MKILVTGTGYIARSFTAFAKNTEMISLRGGSWHSKSFAGYDAVLHTAGYVHVRETRRNQYEYYLVNRDLTVDVAKKAKNDGVKHFVFLSSINVYGLTTGVITENTPAVPTTNYGRSKLAAETLISPLADDNFKIAILRPPMVYGPNSPGNYNRLCRLVKMLPLFPDYPNARSLVHIDNLCAFIYDVIEKKRGGLFFPRDPFPTKTSKLAADIALAQNKNLRLTPVFNRLISLLMNFVFISKLFGSLTVEVEDSVYN